MFFLGFLYEFNGAAVMGVLKRVTGLNINLPDGAKRTSNIWKFCTWRILDLLISIKAWLIPKRFRHLHVQNERCSSLT